MYAVHLEKPNRESNQTREWRIVVYSVALNGSMSIDQIFEFDDKKSEWQWVRGAIAAHLQYVRLNVAVAVGYSNQFEQPEPGEHYLDAAKRIYKRDKVLED